jgi:hypothetical protein
MRYRFTATYAGAVDPLAEDEVAQLVGWWTRRAPAHAPTGGLRDRRAVDIALQADGHNPLDVLLRLSAPLAVPHGPFRLVALCVVDAAWEEDPPAGVSVSRRARPRLDISIAPERLCLDAGASFISRSRRRRWRAARDP